MRREQDDRGKADEHRRGQHLQGQVALQHAPQRLPFEQRRTHVREQVGGQEVGAAGDEQPRDLEGRDRRGGVGRGRSVSAESSAPATTIEIVCCARAKLVCSTGLRSRTLVRRLEAVCASTAAVVPNSREQREHEGGGARDLVVAAHLDVSIWPSTASPAKTQKSAGAVGRKLDALSTATTPSSAQPDQRDRQAGRRRRALSGDA